MWQLTEAGWLYLVADADRAGKALFTLLVNDLTLGEDLSTDG